MRAGRMRRVQKLAMIPSEARSWERVSGRDSESAVDVGTAWIQQRLAATHKHDRLSVIPKRSFVWDTASNDVVGLFVENSGPAPAVIKNFTMTSLGGFSEDISEPPDTFTFVPTYFVQHRETRTHHCQTIEGKRS
jgi:hypothetical protein